MKQLKWILHSWVVTKQGARAAASSPCGNWGRRGILAAALAVLIFFLGMAAAQASETSTAKAPVVVGTDTFDPPGNLRVAKSCSLLPFLFPSTVSLSWTATAESYATGYVVTANAATVTSLSGRNNTSIEYSIAQNTSYTFAVYAISGGKWTSVPVTATAVRC